MDMDLRAQLDALDEDNQNVTDRIKGDFSDPVIKNNADGIRNLKTSIRNQSQVNELDATIKSNAAQQKLMADEFDKIAKAHRADLDEGKVKLEDIDAFKIKIANIEKKRDEYRKMYEYTSSHTKDNAEYGVISGITDPVQYLETVKGVVPGAISGAGSTLTGISGWQHGIAIARRDSLKKQLELYNKVDNGEDVSSELTGYGRYNFKLKRYVSGSASDREYLRNLVSSEISDAEKITPLSERTLHTAGEATKEFSRDILKPRPGYETSVGRTIGEGLGSVGLGLATGAVSRTAMAGSFIAQGSGEALEKAESFDAKEKSFGRAGISDEEKVTAALLGVGPGATDVLPIEIALGRLRVPLPIRRPLVKAIARIGGQAFVEGFQEGGQEYLQNLIAREVYNPRQDLSEGILPSAGFGAGVGGIMQTGVELLFGRRAGHIQGGISQKDRAAGYQKMRESLDNLGIVDSSTRVKAAYTYGALIDGLNSSIDVDSLMGIDGTSKQEYYNALGNVAAAVASGKYDNIPVSQLVDMELSSWSDRYKIRDPNGNTINWNDVVAGNVQIRPQPTQSTQTPEEQNRAEQDAALSELATIDSADAAAERATIINDQYNEEYGKVWGEFQQVGSERNVAQNELTELQSRSDLTEEQKAAKEAELNQKISDLITKETSYQEKFSSIRDKYNIKPWQEVPERQTNEQLVSQEERDTFDGVLRRGIPRKKWAETIGVSAEKLTDMIEDARQRGVVRVDRNGVVRRSSKSLEQPPTEPRQVQGETIAPTEFTEQNRAAIQAAVDEAVNELLPGVRNVVQENIDIARSREDRKYAIRQFPNMEMDDASILRISEEAGRLATRQLPGEQTGISAQNAGGKRTATASGTGARILRSEAATVDVDGTPIIGRRVRGKDGRRTNDNIQRTGTVRKRTLLDGYDTLISVEKIHSGDAQDIVAKVNYYLFDKGTAPKKDSVKSGNAKAIVEMKQHDDGAWEVSYIEVNKDSRNQRLASRLYDAIAKDIGIKRMSPSGVLTSDGYAYWRKRSPESVAFHQPSLTEEEMYYSPRFVQEEMKRVDKLIASVNRRTNMSESDKAETLSDLNEEKSLLDEMWSNISESARSKEFIDSMFALRGFYSPAIRAAESISMKKGTGEQFWKQITKTPGVRKDELEWMGLEEFLRDKKSIAKDEVLSFMRAHQIELDENILGVASDYRVSRSTISLEKLRNLVRMDNDDLPDGSYDDIERISIGADHSFVAFDNSIPDSGGWVVLDSSGERVHVASNYDSAIHIATGIVSRGVDSTTLFSQYKVPGGENYREFLIRLPEFEKTNFTEERQQLLYDLRDERYALEEKRPNLNKDERRRYNELYYKIRELEREYDYRIPMYTSKHFRDQEIVHIRADDRIGPSGKKVLFVNEVQSDLHQSGRIVGYREYISQNDYDAVNTLIDKLEKELGSKYEYNPDELYKDPDWKILSDAYATREGMNIALNAVPNAPFKNDLWLELALKRALLYAAENGYDAISWARSDQIAEAVSADPEKLSIQYDQKIARFLNKYTKKWGGKVEVAQLTDLDGQNQILSITPAMRASVMEGQPLSARDTSDNDVSALAKASPEEMIIYFAARAIEMEAMRTGRTAIAEAVRTARHEVMEIAKGLGLITPAEWSILADEARTNGWIDATGIRQAYENVYADAVNGGVISRSQLEDLILKEAIFEKFADYESGIRNQSDTAKSVFQRILDFFRSVMRKLRMATNMQTANDLFYEYDTGALKDRFTTEYGDIADRARVASLTKARKDKKAKAASELDGLVKEIDGVYDGLIAAREERQAIIGNMNDLEATGDDSFVTRRQMQIARDRLIATEKNMYDLEARKQELSSAINQRLRELGAGRDELLAARTPPSPIELAMTDVRAELGLEMPKKPWKGKKEITLRQQAVAIAQAGGRRVLELYGNEILPALQPHAEAIESMAMPWSTEPFTEGFGRIWSDYTLRPDILARREPQLFSDMRDALDAVAPRLLENMDKLHDLARQRMRDMSADRLIIPGVTDNSTLAWARNFKPDKIVGTGKGYISKAFNLYVRSFQPELVSDKALMADAVFARYKAATAQQKDAIERSQDDIFTQWTKQPMSNRMQYMHDIEIGAPQATSEMDALAKRDGNLLLASYNMEKVWGSKASFREDYFPHIWKNPKRAREVFANLDKALGPKWFQEARFYDTIQEGLKSGLELKSTNPAELITWRLLAGVDMRMRMELLSDLSKLDLARNAEKISSTDIKQYVNAGWNTINAPNKDTWLIAPDIQPLWENAVAARGLWADEGNLGTIFRGWMAFKNVWVPIKLSLSLFHPLHVWHINLSQSMALGLNKIANGDFAGGLKDIVTSIDARQGVGYDARMAWEKLPEERTPYENSLVKLMTEGGFAPQMSEQLKVKAKRDFETAINEGKVFSFLVSGTRRMVEKAQAGFFERWIPGIKAAAYIQQAQNLLKNRPELLDNEELRIVALRSLAKSIDNRFGEMFYSGLFWNKTMKDVGIASFLSLGWNLGFAREFLGAPLKAVGYVAKKSRLSKSDPKRVSADANNKIAYSLVYMTTAMAFAGAITKMLSGDDPEGMDYVFPRIGGTNPDGSPRRVTTMFFTRELPMFMKHVQEQDSYVGGAADMIKNKLLFQPFLEMLNNRDYWGYEIYDPSASTFDKTAQFMEHILTTQINPITFSGAARAKELSGGWDKSIPLSFLGFGPAPAYAERSATENHIRHLYSQYVKPLKQPYETRERDEQKRIAKQKLRRALLSGDHEAIAEARKEAREAGASPQTLTTKRLNTPSGTYLFSRLQPELQRRLLKEMNPEEFKLYRKYSRRQIRREFPIGSNQ